MHNEITALMKYECETAENSDSDSVTDDEAIEDLEVEEEIDVYLNNINENNLNCINTYLIQYPLRPKYRPYNYTNTLQNIYHSTNYNKYRHIKNTQEKLKESFVFEYKLHGYINDKLHKTNISVKENIGIKERKDDSSGTSPDIGRLISSSVLCDYVSSCVGFFKYNEESKKKAIYLIPVKDICQLKPVFENIDEELKGELEKEVIKAEDNYFSTYNKGEGKSEYENKGLLTGCLESKDEAEKKTLGEKKKIESSGHNKMGMPVWEKLNNIYDVDSVEAQEILSLFTNIENRKQIINFHQKKKTKEEDHTYMKFSDDTFAYLNMICRDVEEKEYVTNANACNGNVIASNYNNVKNDIGTRDDIINAYGSGQGKLSANQNDDMIYGNINRFYFFSLTLDEQLLEILRIKNVQTLGEIKKIVKFNEKEEILIETVKKYCVNILGNWVIKSKYLYKFFKGEEEKQQQLNDKNFTFVDYKIIVRNLLIGLIYKQVEPLIIKYVEREKEKIKNDFFAENKEKWASSNDTRSIDKNALKKLNSTNSILIENFEKATNLPNHIILDIFNPLCEYKHTGYYYKHSADEEFLRNNVRLCLLYHHKWKNKLSKIAKLIQKYKNKSSIINDFQIDEKTLEKHIIRILSNNCFAFLTIYEKVKKEFKNSSIDLSVFKKALSIVAININNIWFLNILQENEINNCRNALIHLYQENYNLVLTKAELIKEVEKRLKTTLNIPDIYFRNILKEFCIQKEGRYWFKGNDKICEL